MHKEMIRRIVKHICKIHVKMNSFTHLTIERILSIVSLNLFVCIAQNLFAWEGVNIVEVR